MRDGGTITVHTHDGRELEVMQSGPVGGLPLVLHLGTPNAAADIPQMTVPAHERGLRTLVYSRPGYAGSTPAPGRSAVDVAGDVRTILNAFGLDRFVTVGWSGGGPPALACAALLPERCLAAATLAGLAPYDAEGLDWRAGAEENLLVPASDEELTALLQEDAENLADISGAQITAWLGDLASEVDRAALTGEFADALATSMRRAVSTGIAGWHDDYLSLLHPWGFALSEITIPTTVWQGGQDRLVPYAHGKWLADRIPGARSRLYDDEGHVSLIINHFGSLIDDLLDLLPA
jgi:pimeloyl-ACP methyl ester carboxylesterase